MELIQVTLDTVTDVVSDILENQKEACVFCVPDENCAVVGSNGGANMNMIKNKGIKLVQIKHEGGTIILSPGDVEIGIFTNGYIGNEYRQNIINDIINILKDKGHDPVISGNDVLINGRKVIGFGSRMFGNILYTAIQISININLGLIKSICTKPMAKEPDGLMNYGVTTDDILNIINKTFR